MPVWPIGPLTAHVLVVRAIEANGTTTETGTKSTEDSHDRRFRPSSRGRLFTKTCSEQESAWEDDKETKMNVGHRYVRFLTPAAASMILLKIGGRSVMSASIAADR